MTTDSAAPAHSKSILTWLVPIGLLVATLIAYAPAIPGQFIWDDDYYVVNNPALRSFEGIQQLWLGIFPDWRRYPVPQYYPMTHTSLWLDYRFWGLNSAGYHVTNIVLHALSAWTLWTILRRLFIPGATLAAFVFALHPLHVESVAWITERKNVLSGLLYLLSMLVYLRYAKLDGFVAPEFKAEPGAPELSQHKDYEMALPTEPWKLYALSLLLFVLALLSKSVTATLPGAILLVIWWKRRRIASRDVVPLIPLFVLGLAMSVFTSEMERNVVGAIGEEWNYSIAQRILIAGRAVWFYLGKLILPVNLAFMYDKWTVNAADAAAWIWPALTIVALVALVLARKRIGAGALVGVLFFGGTILPALGFFNYFPMRYSLVADHFAYLASLGFIVPVCAWLSLKLGRNPGLAVGGGAVLCLVLAALTFRQARIYESPIAIWSDTVSKSPRSWMAWNNLSVQQRLAGELDQSQESVDRSLALNPDNTEAVIGRGELAELRGNIPGAIDSYNQAIAMNQRRREQERQLEHKDIVRVVYSVPYVKLAAIHLAAGKPELAAAEYQKALDFAPFNVRALTGYGETLRLLGQTAEALDLQQQAMSINPTIQVRVNLGSALADTGHPNDAIRVWGDVLKEDPNNVDAANNIGLIFAAAGKWRDAINMFQYALDKKPDFKPAQQNLEAAKRRAASQPSTAPASMPSTRPS